MATRLGLARALGSSKAGLLCLWLVMARLIDQGSRLSAVRLAGEHAAAEILGLDDFSEDDLYKAMDWLEKCQAKVEQSLFKQGYKGNPPQLFLYDVTSSYLEGEHNELAEYGYNRDQKRGKKQIVIGLLCDQDGVPISTEVFEGNTSDPKTFASQINKAAKRFGCEQVTFVGDRGMIKSAQIERLSDADYQYITGITKPQIKSMLKKGVFQLDLFDEKLCEIEHGGLRYILRRNPHRAREIAQTRKAKQDAVQALLDKQNEYLENHPGAKVVNAWEKIREKIDKLKIDAWLNLKVNDRQFELNVDLGALADASELDGCYVLKTNVPEQNAAAKVIHARYKDLALVEQAFRTMKTGHLEVRPVFVRKQARTRAHVFIVMLAYRIWMELHKAWRDLDLTVEEGLKQLCTLCATQVALPNNAGYLTVPAPRKTLAKLFAACDITPPAALPRINPDVASKQNTSKQS